MRLLALGRCRPVTQAAVALVAMLLPLSCWATLGDNAASVLTNQSQLKGTIRSVDRQTYVLHEITTSTGAKVREYVSPGGAVFAVAWEGQFAPDFQQLLGPYFQQVQEALAQQKAAQQSGDQAQSRQRRGPVYVKTSGIVFEQSGHLRSFHGQAYVPQLVPQGVQAADIR